MTKATSALLAVFLVLAAPAMTVTAAPADGGNSKDTLERGMGLQSPTEFENTTNRLTLAGDIRSEYAEYSAGLGSALASADDEMRVDHAQYAVVDDGFADASDDERAAMIQSAYDRLTNRIDELEQREQRAVREHAAGDRSSTALLQTLLRNHNEAEVLSQQISILEERAEQVSRYSLSSSRTRAEYKTLEKHQTGLRSNLQQPITTVASDVVITTSQNGYSIAMMDGDQYLVETTRFDARGEITQDRFENGEAYDHIANLYPWASESGPHFQDNSPDYYWAEMGHAQGRLEFYFDGDTGDVYREMQELSVSALPRIETNTWSRSDLNLTIIKTPANGPAKVTVTDSETRDPVDATVSVGSTDLGQTGEDGTMWIAQPLTGYDLTVKSNAGSINATITDR